jgi:hypothetical protein
MRPNERKGAMSRRAIGRVASVLAIGILLGAAGTRALGTPSTRLVVRDAAASTPAFVPACPHFSYGADGTAGPIFCTIDNPAALHYYALALKRLLALGPNASPGQVQSVLAWENKHGGPHGEVLTGTYPIQCQVFQLAAHYWRWQLFYAPPDCSIPPNT